MIPTNRRRVALVIGSGAVKCAAAIGLKRVLDREAIPVDFAVGCSGGSLYASLFALGVATDDMERMTRALWTREVMTKRDTRAILSALFPTWMRFDGAFGMVDDRPAMKALQEPFGGRTYADTEIPLRIVATDFANGERVVLSEGALLDGIRASIAVPFVWKPWTVDGRMLCDGCLSDPMPVDVAMQEGADVILTMGFEAEYPRRVSSALRFAFQVTSIYTNNLYRANYAFHNLAHHAEILPVMPEFTERVGLFDTGKIPYVIEEGERAAEQAVPYLKRLLAAPA
ncbi:MAG: patatin-like phospholipase family protein [Bacteroidota bacterium]